MSCLGCGSRLQTVSKMKPGFVKSLVKHEFNQDSITLKELKLLKQSSPICLRCKTLDSVNYKPYYPAHSIYSGSIVQLLDPFNLNSISNLNPHYAIINKLDLFPPSLIDHLQSYYTNLLKPRGFSSVLLVSAKSGYNLPSLIQLLNSIKTENIYITGYSNVGKSNLLSTLVKIATGSPSLHVSSPNLGTTVSSIKTDKQTFNGLFKSNVIDTPGVSCPDQVLNYLTTREVKLASPIENIFPKKSHEFKSGYTLFIGGILRIDLKSDYYNRVSFKWFGSQKLPIFTTTTAKASYSYTKNIANNPRFMFPPCSSLNRLNSWPGLEFALEANIGNGSGGIDVVIAGIGWVCVYGEFRECDVAVYSVLGSGISVRRRPLIPMNFNETGMGKR